MVGMCCSTVCLSAAVITLGPENSAVCHDICDLLVWCESSLPWHMCDLLVVRVELAMA